MPLLLLLLLYVWLSFLSFLLKFIQFADFCEIIDSKFISYSKWWLRIVILFFNL